MTFKVLVAKKAQGLEDGLIAERFLYRGLEKITPANFICDWDVILLPEDFTIEKLEEIAKRNFSEAYPEELKSYLNNLKKCELVAVELTLI